MGAIDLNSDLGEGAGADERIMPLVTSANIACGGHAGDETSMRETVALALAHGVAIGAHPGYPDRAGFGRVALEMPADRLRTEVRNQIAALREIVEATGGRLGHVKAHGALYNQGERDAGVAGSIVGALADLDLNLVLVAPPGSAMARAAAATGVRLAAEGFIDRAYESDGTLRPRRLAGALLTEPRAAAAQALALVRDRGVRAHDGTFVPLGADTLCVHGDTPGAPEILRAVRAALAAEGYAVRAITP